MFYEKQSEYSAAKIRKKLQCDKKMWINLLVHIAKRGYKFCLIGTLTGHCNILVLIDTMSDMLPT